MTPIGQTEKHTQARIVALFQQRLGYDYLGAWQDRDNRNIEPQLLTDWLSKQGVSEALIKRALHELTRVAGDASKSLYDRNREVYGLLRYGVKVLPAMGENKVTVWLIDWTQPLNNHFAIAQEVSVKGADLGILAMVAKASSNVPISPPAICQATPFSDSAKKCRKFTRHFSQRKNSSICQRSL